MSQLNDTANDGFVMASFAETVYESAVQLHEVDGTGCQTGQRRHAGSEVVEAQANSPSAKSLKRPHCPAIVVENDFLVEFDDDLVRTQRPDRYGVEKRISEVGFEDVRPCHVHVDDEVPVDSTLIDPAMKVLDGTTDHPFSDRSTGS